MTLQIEEMGDGGSFEIFSTMRRIGHRLGLAAWAGEEAASGRYLDRFIDGFETLDTGGSFVRPAQAFATYALGKRRESNAMRRLEGLIAEILAERRRTGRSPDDYLERIGDPRDLPAERDERRQHIMVIHMNSPNRTRLAWTPPTCCSSRIS